MFFPMNPMRASAKARADKRRSLPKKTPAFDLLVFVFTLLLFLLPFGAIMTVASAAGETIAPELQFILTSIFVAFAVGVSVLRARGLQQEE